MLLALPDFPSVTGLLRHLDRGLGGQLSAFEVMWPEFYDAVATAPGATLAARFPFLRARGNAGLGPYPR